MEGNHKYIAVGAGLIFLALMAAWKVAGIAGVVCVVFIPAYASLVVHLWHKKSRWAKVAAAMLLPALLLLKKPAKSRHVR